MLFVLAILALLLVLSTIGNATTSPATRERESAYSFDLHYPADSFQSDLTDQNPGREHGKRHAHAESRHHISHAINLLSGPSLWELSTAVAPPGSRGCKRRGQFFVSIGLNDGGSTPGTGNNAVLLRGRLDCSSNEPSCATDLYQGVLFPLRSPRDQADRSFADNVMARMPDGTILLLRDLALNKLPIPKLDDGAGLWSTVNCGNIWSFRNFLDPADTSSFPPPELTDGTDPAASYGADRIDGRLPGWDREEIYADPFSPGDVYVTMRPGAGINSAGTGDKYFDTLLARSWDGGRSWRSFPLVPSAVVPPVMMSSNPGRIFTFNCEGPPGVPDLSRNEAVLRWSDNRGQSVNGRFIVSEGLSSEFACTSVDVPEGWGVEGSQSISRVRYSERKNAGVTVERLDVVRITYPGVNLQGQQVVHVFEVDLVLGNPPKTKLITTLAAAGAHVIQAAVAEPDPSQVPRSFITHRRPGGSEMSLSVRLATGLITWKVLKSNRPVQLRGAFFGRMGDRLEQDFNIARWSGHTKTGDYSRISFFYSRGKFAYFVPWIAEDNAGHRTLRAVTITQQ